MLNFRRFFEYTEELLETIVQHPQQWSVINPETGKKWRHEDKYKQLARVIKDQSRKGVHPNRIWVTFSDVPRINIRTWVKKEKNTPHGIFAYPAKYILNKKSAEYAGDRPYMIAFKVNGNMIEVGRDPSKGKDKNLKGLIQKEEIPDELNYSKLGSSFSNAAYHPDNYSKRSELRELSDFFSEIIEHIETKEKQNADLNDFRTPEGIIKLYTQHYMDEYLRDNYNGTFDGEKVTINKTNLSYPDVQIGTHPVEYFAGKDGDIPYYATHAKHIKEKFDKALVNEEFNKILNKLADTISKRIDFKNKKLTNNTRPIISKVAAMAKEYGIDDITPFIKRVSENNSFHRGTQFIYLLIKDLAGHLANKTGRNRAIIWASMLRKIGFTHVVDSKHSAVIHSGEPTQGVFMDTNQIEPVAIIFNRKNADPRMLPSGYEKSSRENPLSATGSWEGGSAGQHGRTGLMTQKAGDELSGVSDKEDVIEVLGRRIEMIKSKMGGDYYSPDFQKNLFNIMKLAKQIKSSFDPNNHEEKTKAENVLNKLETYVSYLKDKINDITKTQTTVTPAIKDYQDALKSRLDMINNVIKDPEYKTGTVKKLNPFDTATFIKDILTHSGPLSADALKREFGKLGIASSYSMNSSIENLVLDKTIHKKYSDLYDAYIYYLDGQKIPKVEDYEEDITKALTNTHKTTAEIAEAMQGKIANETLSQILKSLSYSGKIVKSRDIEGNYFWHLPDYGFHEKLVEKYKDRIFDYFKEQEAAGKPTLTGQQVIRHFSYDYGLNITPVLNTMIQNKMINIEEGTYGEDDVPSLTLTLRPVPQPKPMYYNSTKELINTLFAGVKKVYTRKELAQKTYYSIGIAPTTAKNIIDIMIQNGDLHVIEDNANADDKKLSNAPAAPVVSPPIPTNAPVAPVTPVTPAPHPGTPAATPTGPTIKDSTGHEIKVGDKVHKSINPTKIGTVTNVSVSTVTVNWDDGAYSGNSYYGAYLTLLNPSVAAPAPAVKPWHGLGANTPAKTAWTPPTPEEKHATLSEKIKNVQAGLPKKISKPVKYARLIRGVGSNLSIDNVITQLEPILGFKFTPAERQAIKKTYEEESSAMSYYGMRGHLKFPKNLTPDQAYNSQMKNFPNPPHVALDAEFNKKLDELLIKHDHVSAVQLIKTATQFDTSAATALIILKKLETYFEGKIS